MAQNPLFLYDPRGRVEDPRPLDRWFYNRDSSDDRTVVSSATPTASTPQGTSDIQLDWTFPANTPPFEAIQVIRDDDASNPQSATQHFVIATLPTSTTSYIDSGAANATPAHEYRVEAVRLKKDDDKEIEEYDRHRMMFWELYADYWNDKYKGDNGEYAKYYSTTADDGTVTPPTLPGWLEEIPTPPDLNDMKPPGTHRIPNHRDVDDDEVRAKMNEAHQAMDKSMEAYGAARGCYEVWTDMFIDITDGFRGLYQMGDVRTITKAEKVEEYAYVKNSRSYNYAAITGHDSSGNPEYDSEATIRSYTGTSDVPISHVRDETHAGSITDRTEATGLIDAETSSGQSQEVVEADDYIFTKTKVGGKALGDPAGVQIFEYVAGTGANVPPTLDGGYFDDGSGTAHTEVWGNVRDWNFGRVDSMVLGGSAGLQVGASLDCFLGIKTDISLAGAVDIVAIGLLELFLGKKTSVTIGPSTEYETTSLKVRPKKVDLDGKITKLTGSVSELNGDVMAMALQDKKLGIAMRRLFAKADL